MSRVLMGKSLLNSLCGVHSMILAELKARKAASAVPKDLDADEFREQHRRQRMNS
jgi:hypothetical protein